jgi:hypothetical protein
MTLVFTYSPVMQENELVTILNTAQALEIRGLTDTVSGPKSKEDAGALKLSPTKDHTFTTPTKEPAKPKRGTVPFNNQHIDNGGGERKRSKMDMVNEAQQILDSQVGTNAIADNGMTEVKQEFGAVTIERGVKDQSNYDGHNNYQKQEASDTGVTNMGYDGFEDDNDTTEYLPQDGVVLQDDDRVSPNDLCSPLLPPLSFQPLTHKDLSGTFAFHVCPVFCKT